MPNIYVNDAGTWRQIQDVYVNDAGTWRRIQEVYVNDAGTWRSVHTGDIVSISPVIVEDQQFSPTPLALARYILKSDGTIQGQTVDLGTYNIGTWCTPGSSASLYEVFAAPTGDPVNGDPIITWLNLGTDRSWDVVAENSFELKFTELQITIRRDSDGQVMTQEDITLSASLDV